MSFIFIAVFVLGVLSLVLSVTQLRRWSKSDKEYHVHVGDEWITLDSYRKRFPPASEANHAKDTQAIDERV